MKSIENLHTHTPTPRLAVRTERRYCPFIAKWPARAVALCNALSGHSTRLAAWL